VKETTGICQTICTIITVRNGTNSPGYYLQIACGELFRAFIPVAEFIAEWIVK